MRITKRQLRSLIKEEKARLLREQFTIIDDMHELLKILDKSANKASEIEKKMQDVKYAQLAGGREADDLELALANVWQAFGGQSLSAEGFDE